MLSIFPYPDITRQDMGNVFSVFSKQRRNKPFNFSFFLNQFFPSNSIFLRSSKFNYVVQLFNKKSILLLTTRMIVYRDIISGDEMLSDAYKVIPVTDKDGNAVEGLMMCESKNITKADGDIDVGCGNAFGSGGGGEDGGEGGVDNAAVTVNNVIDGFQYTETQIGTANDFKVYIYIYKYLSATLSLSLSLFLSINQ